MISCELVKCWSCSEVPNDLPSTPYILYKSQKLIDICRSHNHNFFPISFHDKVKCVLCNIDNLDPNYLGVHHEHPLVGMIDWKMSYKEPVKCLTCKLGMIEGLHDYELKGHFGHHLVGMDDREDYYNDIYDVINYMVNGKMFRKSKYRMMCDPFTKHPRLVDDDYDDYSKMIERQVK